MWMFVVWPTGFFALEYAQTKVNKFHFIVRAGAYAIVCLSVEYAFGMFFKYVLGDIPWNYSYSDFHIDGAIRLDYIPFWALAGLVSERVIGFVNRVRINGV